jgi:hypothetical protein
MTQLVSFYDQEPLRNDRVPELTQVPLPETAQWEFPYGAAVTHVVYVRPPIEKRLLVPFAAYDDWLLRDRYNEALRIVNALGASEVLCGSSRSESRKLRGIAQYKEVGPSFESIASRLTDVQYHHIGRGSEPRDPAPLRWPDEPGFDAARLAVLQNGASEISLAITSRSDFDVKGDLGERLKKLGLALGAGREKSESTTLHLAAKFPTRDGWGRRR